MRAHPLPEARALRRPDARRAAQGDPVVPDAGSTCPTGAVAWSDYLDEHPRPRRPSVVGRALRRRRRRAAPPAVTLVDFDPDGEDKLLAAICYPHTDLPEDQIARPGARAWAPTSGWRSCGPTSASATNRRHKPGRAFERTDYRFDVLADYGAFRDLQRHRMLTIEWQPLTPAPRLRRARSRSTTPGCAERVRRGDGALGRAATTRSPSEFPRAGALRGVARLPGPLRDADERPRGHAHARAAHRRRRATRPTGAVAQEMHRLIAEQAGHRAVAEAMRYVDHSPEPELERLDGRAPGRGAPAVPLTPFRV